MSSGVDSGYAAALLPDDARPAQVVVCERTGWWAAGLRRELGPGGPRVRQTRTLDDLAEALLRSPASFAVVELTPEGLERLVAWLVRLERDFPLARVAVVADRSLAACEGLVREVGVVHFTCSLRQVSPLAEVARRHLQAAPGPRWGFAERIWAELPWNEGETSRESPARGDRRVDTDERTLEEP